MYARNRVLIYQNKHTERERDRDRERERERKELFGHAASSLPEDILFFLIFYLPLSYP